ncbi:hypothetical protein HPB47_002459 [Ixodes persulcatus]|uniref:Uncharacterized protein n=1 Tax=Ixodes persulcatus TaxID=34615 RepID=A0AC60PL79_IXOPE|nr:hypothetical protein HPB47_002459 [Ixodes persulcatus]
MDLLLYYPSIKENAGNVTDRSKIHADVPFKEESAPQRTRASGHDAWPMWTSRTVARSTGSKGRRDSNIRPTLWLATNARSDNAAGKETCAGCETLNSARRL